jgi:hypothetical protein
MGGEYSTANKEESDFYIIQAHLQSECKFPSIVCDLIQRYATVYTVLFGWEFANGHQYTLDKVLGPSNIGFYREAPKDCDTWPKHAKYVCIRLDYDIGWAFKHADAIVVAHCSEDLLGADGREVFQKNREKILSHWKQYLLPTLIKINNIWSIKEKDHDDDNHDDRHAATLLNWITFTDQKQDWASSMLNKFELVLPGYSREQEEAERESYGLELRKVCHLCQQQEIPRSDYTIDYGYCKSCGRKVCGNHLAASNHLCDDCDQDNKETQQRGWTQKKKRRITRYRLKR